MKFDRFKKLIGEESFTKIKNLHVMIVGLGGVGGYTLEALARCGIEKFTIIDFDKVDETNINRQIIANINTIGKYKVDLFEGRIKEINPSCEVISIKEKLTEDNVSSVVEEYKPTFVVDACDDIKVKKALIKHTTLLDIPFISSMGTGKRLDPSKLEITTLDRTTYDPIARILRKFVKDEKINKKIAVVASREEPIKTEGAMIASCSFVPSSAGLLVASYIINKTK